MRKRRSALSAALTGSTIGLLTLVFLLPIAGKSPCEAVIPTVALGLDVSITEALPLPAAAPGVRAPLPDRAPGERRLAFSAEQQKVCGPVIAKSETRPGPVRR